MQAWLLAASLADTVPAPAAMIKIPAGTMRMGSPARPDERPVHPVSLPAFEMDRVEVTATEYQRCVDAGKCSAPGNAKTCNLGQPGRENHPINCVDWNQATNYCQWAGKRLPSEEEWEYAARGSDGRSYPWGKTKPTDKEVCWRRFASEQGTCAVGSHPAGASAFGLLDMAGNVWEWTASGFSRNYGKPRSDELRVNRGGGWGDVQVTLFRATTRGRWPASKRLDVLGFRCAR